jgi:sulfur carrier protein
MSEPFVEVAVNGQLRQLPQATHVAGLIEILGVRGRTAVEINGEVVPRSQHATTPLRAGDRIEIVRAIGGG